MSVSDVSMSSNALLLIGHSQINSFEDAGAGAKVAAALYTNTYEDLLSQHRWRFAVGKAQLNQLTATPLNEFRYAYQLPADLLQLIRTYPSSDYEIFQDKLYSNNNTVEIDYTFKPDESKLPTYFVTLMEYALAMKFAVPITEKESKADVFRKMFNDQLRRAKFIDSQGRPSDEVVDSPLVDARF